MTSTGSTEDGGSPEVPADESADDAMRRRYREALERKHGSGPGANNSHTGPRAAAPTSNDKRQRTFRRKSGG
jgi:phage-related baseplate assembly protein